MNKGELRRKFFIAVFPPRNVVEKVGKIMLKGPEHWSWNKKDNLHISLAFPGHLLSDDLDRLKGALEKIEHKAFDISLQGVGFFLDNKNKVKKQQEHVLWMRPDLPSDIEIRTLHREIIGLMKDAGFSYGRDDFSPHMTLAKVERNEIDLMKEFSSSCSDVKTRSWRCGSIALYESLNRNDDKHPANNEGKGSKYKKIAEFKLAV